MRIAMITIRVLLGALLLFGSIPYFLNLLPQPELTGGMKVFNDGLNSAVYLIPLVKAIELVCGVAFLFNRFVVLATIVVFPVILNIFCVQLFLAPIGLPVAVFLLLSVLFLMWRNKAFYKSLLVYKPQANY